MDANRWQALIGSGLVDALDAAVSELCREYRENQDAEDWWFKKERIKYTGARDALIRAALPPVEPKTP